jgi:hypothetical protein
MSATLCEECDKEVSWDLRNCPTCGKDAGCPNVRHANEFQQCEALEKRYSDAIADAATRNISEKVKLLESHATKSVAVINVDVHYLRSFLQNSDSFYSNYALMVRGDVRRAAERQNDRARSGVEGLLFGRLSDQIRYAALSLDGHGLTTYGGSFGMVLSDQSVRRRASILERNSYDFVQEHDIKPCALENDPPGYRSDWSRRHRLTIAKLAHRINNTTKDSDLPKIVLTKGKNRSEDEFLEVHIHGTFSRDAVAAVSGPSKVSENLEQVILNEVRQQADSLGLTWIDP